MKVETLNLKYQLYKNSYLGLFSFVDFEGALRKWVLPSLATPLLIVVIQFTLY
jgi:hypothetical protein